ncbi:MAG: hypothetical protein V8R16_04480 [Bacilli bacterium]
MKNNVIKMMTDVSLFATLGLILDVVQGTICDFLPFWPNGAFKLELQCAVFLLFV